MADPRNRREGLGTSDLRKEREKGSEAAMRAEKAAEKLGGISGMGVESIKKAKARRRKMLEEL